MTLFRTAGYGTDVELFDGVKINYTDAGHLLGSSSVLFMINENGVEKSILFSGDLGNVDKPLIRSPQDPPHADYVVCESTYGDRVHSAKPDYLGQLTQIIQRTLDRGGNVVIPAFAVGRTQEILYFIRIIKEEGLIKGHDGFPVVVDSPLAVEATNIYSTEMYEYYDDEALDLLRAGINPVAFPDLRLSVSSDESKAINADTTPKVILSASGMCEAGRIRHHLKHNLWRPECTVMFVGYQSQGTVGSKILDGVDSVKLFGEEISVKAEIVRIESFSSHADKDHLREWVKKAEPSARIFINHGEDEVTDKFAAEAEAATGKPAVAPYSGEVWDLASNELVHKANVVPVIRKQMYNGVDDHRSFSNASPAYRDLRKSGQDLMDLINKSQGGANKELNKMRREIEEIIKKYNYQEESNGQ
jgi:metallo-beta-lactamase family protein